MQFLLTDEDQLVLETATARFEAGRRVVDDGATWNEERRALAGEGWLATVVADDGPQGAVPVLVAEAAGKAGVALPFAEVGVAVPAALAAAPDQEERLRRVVAGVEHWPIAGAGLLFDGLRGRAPLRVVARDGDLEVRGSAFQVHGAEVADGFLVVALDERDDAVLLAVPRSGAERIVTDRVADESCPTATVVFDDAAVTTAERLPDDALRQMARWGAAASAAEMLGAAEALRDMSVEYARTREQFGVPIGSFQAVKHHCADMHVLVESLRVAVWAAGIHAVDPEPGIDHVAVAKSCAQDHASEVGRRSLQVHGGIGFTWEHPLHRYLKRIMRLQSAFGDARWHRRQLARGVVSSPGGDAT